MELLIDYLKVCLTYILYIDRLKNIIINYEL